MARVTVPFLHPFTNLQDDSEAASLSPSLLFEDSSSSSVPSTSSSSHAWSSQVFAFDKLQAEKFLHERRKCLQDYTSGLPQHRANLHFNHQLFPSGAGPFDLLLRVDSTSVATPTTAKSNHEFPINSNSNTTATTTTATAQETNQLLPLHLTCRVGGACLHFLLEECYAQVASLNTTDSSTSSSTQPSSDIPNECHLSRTTAAHLRRLAARWCPVVSYCTAAALSHPGWTNKKNTRPTVATPVVVCPCAHGIQLQWMTIAAASTGRKK